MISSLSEMYSFPFMQYALAVGVLGGGMLAFLGVFVHLRRIVFLGAALPQVVALGIAVAVFVSLPPLAGAVAGGALGVFVLSLLSRNDRLPRDGWIGLAYAAGSSVAVVLVSLSPAPDGTVLRFFTGDVLGTGRMDVLYTIAVLVPVAIIFFLFFWKRFVMCGFDPSTARALGIRVNLWDALLFIFLALALSIVMNTAGGMLAFSMLIGPPAAALLLFRSFKLIIPAAVIFGVLAAFGGLTTSFMLDTPGGPTMGAAALATAAIAWIIRTVSTVCIKNQRCRKKSAAAAQGRGGESG